MKLSDLVANRRYRITADGLDATFHVVTPGVMPMVLLNGDQDTEANDGPTQLVQLIGPIKFTGEVLADPMPSFLDLDGELDGTWLYYIVQIQNYYEIKTLACDPDIKPID